MDADGDALCEAHPGEDGVDGGDALILALGLGNTDRLGHETLRLQRFDLPLRDIQASRCRLLRGLMLMQLGRELLGILDAGRASRRELLKAGSLLLCEFKRRLSAVQLGLAGADLCRL